jgi:hypothetical protein
MYLPSCFNRYAFDLVRLMKIFHERLYWVANMVRRSSPEKLDLSTFLLCASERKAITA